MVKHEEPDPAKLELAKGPPAEAAQTHSYDGEASPINEEVVEWNDVSAHNGNREESPVNDEGEWSGPQRYAPEDDEEFRNVWEGDEESK